MNACRYVLLQPDWPENDCRADGTRHCSWGWNPMPPGVPPRAARRGSKTKAQGAFHEENSTRVRRSHRPSGGLGSRAKSAGTEAIAGCKLAAEHTVSEGRPREGPEGQPVR